MAFYNPGDEIQESDVVNSRSSASDAAKGVKLDSDGRIDPSFIKRGGSGADGALSISSGTTTIDCGNARVVVKNYSSISITGTGKLAFSNPHASGTIVILRSQGDVTLTSSTAPMIDMSGMGAAAGTNATVWDFIGLLVDKGDDSDGSSGGVGGAKGTFDSTGTTITSWLLRRFGLLQVGAGGGDGEAEGSGTAGIGDRGGGGLIIECGGAWNFTTAGGISVAGADGNDGSGGSPDFVYGGGGGGGGGFCIVFYNELTANSGTITVSGGTGGEGGWSGSYSGGQNVAWGGGGGGSMINNGSTGTKLTTGSPPSSGTGTTGGSGGDGYSNVEQFSDAVAV